jgi:hypothetical protein
MKCWYSCTELYSVIREECKLDTRHQSYIVILCGEGTPPFYTYDGGRAFNAALIIIYQVSKIHAPEDHNVSQSFCAAFSAKTFQFVV